MSKSKNRQNSPTENENFKEFGGYIGVFSTILGYPLYLLIALIYCNKNNCTIFQTTNFNPYLLSIWWDRNSFLLILIYSFLIAALQFLRIGGKKVKSFVKDDQFVYPINSLSSLIIVTFMVILLNLKGYALNKFLIEHIFHLFSSTVILSFTFSILVYIKSFLDPSSALNSNAYNTNIISGYFLGRETNPRIFNLDLKMLVLRLSLFGAMCLDMAYIVESNSVQNNYTLLLLGLIHTIYNLDGILFEEDWLTSFEVQYESFGFVGTVGYLLYPFMSVIQVKYIVEHNIILPPWKLALIFVTFLVGYILFRGSNAQKAALRKNQSDAKLADLQVIHTKNGGKLLISGFWGFVRHPNYLGDMLINLSFIIFLPLKLPSIILWADILFLLFRSRKDHKKCQLKYGADWDKYCKRVKYILIPKIY